MAEGGRVIAGAAAGIRLEAGGAGTRPLAGRVKGALFASLTADGAFEGEASFLDLFAGSGAGGIEALSRGAATATFVERDERACAVIRRNVERAAPAGGQVIGADVLGFLAATPPAAAPYRAVLLDPPYGEASLDPALARLGTRAADWLTPDAVVVAKHFWRDEPPAVVGALVAFRRRRFGETMLTFYRVSSGEEAAAAEER
jgi:16S rRNA (guanine966-N2)-methyltransferase